MDQNLTRSNSTSTAYTYGISETIVWTSIILLTIMALGIFGNTLVIASFIKFRRLRTVTNYFLVSLAVADLMLASLSIPFWSIIRLQNLKIVPKESLSTMVLYYSWQFLDILCSTASISNLCFIAVDRHLAIASPLHYYAKMTPKRAITSIAGGWIYAFICASLSLISTDYNIQPIAGRVYAAFIVLAAYFVPLLIILFYYGKISAVAFTQAKRLNAEGTFIYGAERERRTLVQRELKISKTLAIVVGTFLVCWTPFFLISLVYAVCTLTCLSSRINSYVAASKWMQYLSTTANPIIYTFCTSGFRQAFQAMLYCPDLMFCKIKHCTDCSMKLMQSKNNNERLVVRGSYNKTKQKDSIVYSCSVYTDTTKTSSSTPSQSIINEKCAASIV